MPIPLISLQQRLRRVGKLRMGHQVAGSGNKTRPERLEKWRLTSTDRSALEHVARMYGGTVQPWAGEPGQFELYTDATEIYIKLWPTEVTIANEFWSAAGRQRTCQGPGGTCRKIEVVNGEAVEHDVPCFCEDLPDKEQCKLTLRLDFQLAGVPSMGSWGLESHGVFAATELPMQVRHLTTMYPHGALCILAIEPREIKQQGKPLKKFCVPVIRVRPGMPEDVAALGGTDISALIAAGPVPQALESGAPALPASVNPETGEILDAEPTPTPQPDVAALGAAAMAEATEFIASCELATIQVDALKKACSDAGKRWVNEVLKAKRSGVSGAMALLRFTGAATDQEETLL